MPAKDLKDVNVDFGVFGSKHLVLNHMKRFSMFALGLFIVIALIDTYSPLNVVPLIGRYASTAIAFPIDAVTRWAARPIFDLSDIAAVPHASDSRDAALNWVALLVSFLISTLGAVVCYGLRYRRRTAETIVNWTRYLVRLMLIFIMLRYAVFKIFPLQMSRPSLAVLNESVGHSSPMSLLWTLIGLSPAYQIISGLLEALSALLLMSSRTALLGALFGFVIMIHVLLLNLCFDVPVKLGAMLILAAFTYLLIPDLPSLVRFFWRNMSANTTGSWRPNSKNPQSKRAAGFLEALYILCVLWFTVPSAYQAAAAEAANYRSPSVLTGQWHLDSSYTGTAGQIQSVPVLTGEGSPITALYFEADGRVMARSADERLWRAGATIDTKLKRLTLSSGYFEGTNFSGDYEYSETGPNHLRLNRVGENAGNMQTLLFTRVPLAAHYPLLETRFHWIQEWALER